MGDIKAHIRDIYGVEVSDTTVIRITDKILPVAKEWQQRSLEAVYAVVFLDAIHYHVRSEGQIVKKVEDIFIACTDNLTGFSAAIEPCSRKRRYRTVFLSALPSLDD